MESCEGDFRICAGDNLGDEFEGGSFMYVYEVVKLAEFRFEPDVVFDLVRTIGDCVIWIDCGAFGCGALK